MIGEPITPENSEWNGGRWGDTYPFEEHDWSAAWVDPGGASIYHSGPYLKVPHPESETVNRVYPRKKNRKPELVDGVWCWVTK